MNEALAPQAAVFQRLLLIKGVSCACSHFVKLERTSTGVIAIGGGLTFLPAAHARPGGGALCDAGGTSVLSKSRLTQTQVTSRL
jgi:hypothetical protein